MQYNRMVHVKWVTIKPIRKDNVHIITGSYGLVYANVNGSRS